MKCASDLYRTLAKHYTDLKVLLARFIYALEKLGHRRYGYRAIRVLPITDRPAPFDHSKLQPKVAESEFIFFQRLAALCCMLPRSYHTKFIAYLAKKLGTNPSLHPTPCDILTKSLMENIITTDNQFNEIEEALVELPESQIKEYFDKYEKISKI